LLVDGRIARVPSGPIRPVALMRQVIDVDKIGLEQYLRAIDREHELGRAVDPALVSRTRWSRRTAP
jgi:hypothetical protein